MTKDEFEVKLEDMLTKSISSLRKDGMKLFESGGIDPEEFENDYLLPKIILSVILKNLSFQYLPLSKEAKAQAKNLEHF